MTCESVRVRLDDLADGELAPAERAAVLEHLDGCAACAEELGRLRRLLAAARELPREREPGFDLWPGIERRLPRRRPERVRFAAPGARWSVLAAAAAVVMALSSLWVGRPREATPGLVGAPLTPASQAVGDLLRAEREYARATASLMAAVESQRDALSPETRRVVAQNLATIDAALDDIRAALEANPGSEQLAGLLTATHRRKVEVLQTVLRLSQSRHPIGG